MTVADQVRRAGIHLPFDVVNQAVRTIVDIAAPEKIIVFGSAARGDMGPRSDLDVLVIK